MPILFSPPGYGAYVRRVYEPAAPMPTMIPWTPGVPGLQPQATPTVVVPVATPTPMPRVTATPVATAVPATATWVPAPGPLSVAPYSRPTGRVTTAAGTTPAVTASASTGGGRGGYYGINQYGQPAAPGAGGFMFYLPNSPNQPPNVPPAGGKVYGGTTQKTTTGAGGGGTAAPTSKYAPPKYAWTEEMGQMGMGQERYPQWYQAFQQAHAGMTPEQFYGQPGQTYTGGPGYTPASGLQQALEDSAWGDQFYRAWGRAPNDYEWQEHWYSTHGGRRQQKQQTPPTQNTGNQAPPLYGQ